MNPDTFRAALLDPGLAVPEGLTGPDGSPAGRRFDVYRNNVTVSLTEALRQAFPVIEKLVGPEFFAAMARDFLRAHPPASPVLALYGAALPDWLARFPPVAHLGYLPDVARLEQALREAYHAADTESAPVGALAALTPAALEGARLTLVPAARLVRSRWPIHAIWLANARSGPPPERLHGEDVLVLRPQYDPEPHLLPGGAGAFVAALIAGATVAEAAAAAPAADLPATFSILVSGGAIGAVIA